MQHVLRKVAKLELAETFVAEKTEKCPETQVPFHYIAVRLARTLQRAWLAQSPLGGHSELLVKVNPR